MIYLRYFILSLGRNVVFATRMFHLKHPSGKQVIQLFGIVFVLYAETITNC